MKNKQENISVKFWQLALVCVSVLAVVLPAQADPVWGDVATISQTVEQKVCITQGGHLNCNGANPTIDASGNVSATGYVRMNQGRLQPVAGSAGISTSVDVSGAADNLGDHTATQVVNLDGNYISGDTDAEGLAVAASGQVSLTHALRLARDAGETCSSLAHVGRLRVNPANNKIELCIDK